LCFEIIGFATIFNQYMACHPWDQRDKFFFPFFVCVKLNAAPISPTLSQFGPGQKPKWSWKAKFWAFGRSLKVKTLIDSLHDGQKISMYKYIICKCFEEIPSLMKRHAQYSLGFLLPFSVILWRGRTDISKVIKSILFLHHTENTI
jgi:hypothetical protein